MAETEVTTMRLLDPYSTGKQAQVRGDQGDDEEIVAVPANERNKAKIGSAWLQRGVTIDLCS